MRAAAAVATGRTSLPATHEIHHIQREYYGVAAAGPTPEADTKHPGEGHEYLDKAGPVEIGTNNRGMYGGTRTRKARCRLIPAKELTSREMTDRTDFALKE